MRRHLSFVCHDVRLAATLDEASGTTGLLILSGGNEIRSGAHGGMATLADHIAKSGHPVFRFDRRGIGDSEGENGGFLDSRDDLLAAIAAFGAACPQIERLVGFGNCDAASALLLHQPLALNALILANPWTYDENADDTERATDTAALPPASAIRARYWARLKDPKSLLRLMKGEVDLGKLARGLAALGKNKPEPADDGLAARLYAAFSALRYPATILLASGDRTAMAFAEHWDSPAWVALRDRHLTRRLDSPSHSFAGEDAAWLAEQIAATLK